MKNIHILPTDKPSRVVKIYNDVNRETFTLKLDVEVNDSFKEYVNIYITSDEEIKDVRPHKGKWHLEKENILNKFPDYLTDLSECKLVIMTTGQDLINDGVQAIDDEFLEWFVKNPSCEYIEVIPLRKSSGWYDEKEIWHWDFLAYKIVIPKEEHKQETPEEAAERLYPTTINSFTDSGFDMSETERLIFINGAKWQQERMYSEKEVINILIECCGEVSCEDGILTGKTPEELYKWISEKFKKK